jgi:hypothetical protein
LVDSSHRDRPRGRFLGTDSPFPALLGRISAGVVFAG